MGQIQNSIEGLAGKFAMAKAGNALIQSDKEMQAIQAQDKATAALDDKAKADETALTTDVYKLRAKQELESKASKYGLLHDDKGGVITQFFPADAKFSKNKAVRQNQINSITASQHRLDKAIEANDYAKQVADFKNTQYEIFKKRAKMLAKKAKMDPSTLIDFQKAEENYKLSLDNRWSMPDALKKTLEGGKK